MLCASYHYFLLSCVMYFGISENRGSGIPIHLMKECCLRLEVCASSHVCSRECQKIPWADAWSDDLKTECDCQVDHEWTIGTKLPHHFSKNNLINSCSISLSLTKLMMASLSFPFFLKSSTTVYNGRIMRLFCVFLTFCEGYCGRHCESVSLESSSSKNFLPLERAIFKAFTNHMCLKFHQAEGGVRNVPLQMDFQRIAHIN